MIKPTTEQIMVGCEAMSKRVNRMYADTSDWGVVKAILTAALNVQTASEPIDGTGWAEVAFEPPNIQPRFWCGCGEEHPTIEIWRACPGALKPIYVRECSTRST